MEDELVRIWVTIARDEIPKVHKLFNYGFIAKQNMYRRLSSVASGPKGALRAGKRNDVPLRAKKLVKGVAEHYRRTEREEIEKKKQAEREAYEKSKKDEENREAQRQAKKLEFLLTQTELYSHFVGNKGKDAGEDDDGGDDNEPPVDPTLLDFETGTYAQYCAICCLLLTICVFQRMRTLFESWHPRKLRKPLLERGSIMPSSRWLLPQNWRVQNLQLAVQQQKLAKRIGWKQWRRKLQRWWQRG